MYNSPERVLAEKAELEDIATSIKKLSEDFVIGPIRERPLSSEQERLLPSPGNRP